MDDSDDDLSRLLGELRPDGQDEERAVAELVDLVEREADPYDRALPLHLTGSAVVLDLDTKEVLLRWHARLGAWLQVGGHGDEGERDPLEVACREAEEETGLFDLSPWPPGGAPVVVHVVVVSVPARENEAAHRHGDVRYLLTTNDKAAVTPEHDGAPLRWVPLDEAIEEVGGTLRETLVRVRRLLGSEPAVRDGAHE